MVINPIVGVYIPIIRIPYFSGGMAIPNTTSWSTLAHMEATNHLIEKEHHFPILHFWVPCLFSRGATGAHFFVCLVAIDAAILYQLIDVIGDLFEVQNVGCEPSRWLSTGSICWVVPLPSISHQQAINLRLPLILGRGPTQSICHVITRNSPEAIEKLSGAPHNCWHWLESMFGPLGMQLELFEHKQFGHTKKIPKLAVESIRQQLHTKQGSSCDTCQSTWIHIIYCKYYVYI